MQEAGFDLVAIGEFVWRVFEPEEGIYDFELFDEAIQVLGDHDIDVMLCTPTAAMPAWVQQKVPDANVAVRLRQSRAPVAHATGGDERCPAITGRRGAAIAYRGGNEVVTTNEERRGEG